MWVRCVMVNTEKVFSYGCDDFYGRVNAQKSTSKEIHQVYTYIHPTTSTRTAWPPSLESMLSSFFFSSGSPAFSAATDIMDDRACAASSSSSAFALSVHERDAWSSLGLRM